jgi:hypothetical protein
MLGSYFHYKITFPARKIAREYREFLKDFKSHSSFGLVQF